MVATESGGVWGQATEIGLPAGANTTVGQQAASLNSISCTAVGDCVAVGSYLDSSGDLLAMVVSESGGAWGQPVAIASPSDASAGPYTIAELTSVSCVSVGSCVAVGIYSAGTTGSPAPMVVTESGGVWGQASDPVAEPSGAVTGEHGFAYLTSVSCPSAGDCEAAGIYTAHSGNLEPMIATELNGVWRRAAKITLPANAPSGDGAQFAELTSVSCGSPTHCAAVGSYFDGTGVVPMAVMGYNDHWGQASEIQMPANQSTTNQNGTLAVVSCQSNGTCEAGGSYSASSANTLAMVVPEVNGVWGPATDTPRPAGAGSAPGRKLAEILGMSCTNDGGCGAVGDYGYLTDTAANIQAMALTSTRH